MDGENPVAAGIDGARPDWRVSPDAMRWTPEGPAEEHERASVVALIEQHRAAALGLPDDHEPVGPRTPERVGPLAAGVVRELTAGSRLALPPGAAEDDLR